MKIPSAKTSQVRAGGLTLADYAIAKKLPVDFLKSLGLRDIFRGSSPSIRVPYLDERDNESAVRFRLSMDHAEQRFAWRQGSKLCPYGLWRLDRARKLGHIDLVEGESDCHTLWFSKVPALGLPGANSWKEDWAAHFDGIATIYVWIEPDQGGAAMLKWLANSAIRDRVRLVKVDGVKDPSALYLKSPKEFRDARDAAIAKSQPWIDRQAAEIKEQKKLLWKECKELAEDEDILERFASALIQRGAIGVTRNAKILYLALTTRFLDRIVSVGLKGPSSGGKSYLLDSVLAFFPPESYHVLTAMSERALIYSEEQLSHRFVVLYEAAALGNEWAAYFVRSLMSEGRLIYETVEKTASGIRSRRIEREGPTGLLTTTTAVNLHAENETRLFSLRIDDTPKQTKRIIESEARKVSGEAEQPSVEDEALLRSFRALQSWIGCAQREVTVPFAPAVAELIPPVAVRLRRDFAAVMSFVQAHALLHQSTRERDARGRIVATLEDYEQVRDLVRAPMAEATEQAVAKTVRETVEAAKKIVSSKSDKTIMTDISVSIKEVAQILHLDRSAASRRVHDCLDRGLLETTEPIKKGMPIRLVLGEPLPDDKTLLPEVEVVRKHWNRKMPAA